MELLQKKIRAGSDIIQKVKPYLKTSPIALLCYDCVATSATSTTNHKQKVNNNTCFYIRNPICVQ